MKIKQHITQAQMLDTLFFIRQLQRNNQNISKPNASDFFIFNKYLFLKTINPVFNNFTCDYESFTQCYGFVLFVLYYLEIIHLQ